MAVWRKALPEEESDMVLDADICHGTAGIAQFFRRMYFNTGNNQFLSANQFWIDETLKMAKWGKEGAAGFKAWTEEPVEWVNEYTFLKGVAGIGLALYSHKIILIYNLALLLST